MSIYICSRLISYEQPDERAPALRQFNTLSIALIVSPPVGALTPTQIDDRLGTAKSQTIVHESRDLLLEMNRSLPLMTIVILCVEGRCCLSIAILLYADTAASRAFTPSSGLS
jgi:hypothetical protein